MGTVVLDTAEILAQARPAVVTVLTHNEDGNAVGQGSGFVVARDGVVVTAWHVVAGASGAQVKLSNGAYFPVEGLIAWEAEKDFAVLKVAGTELPTVPLGDCDLVRQGDRILTLGSPLGLELTASEGIVSAVRELPNGGRRFQITAPISPGSSGGPVLNGRGQAIGIASFFQTEGQNLNFATSIDDLKPKLAARGEVTSLAEVGVPEFADSAIGSGNVPPLEGLEPMCLFGDGESAMPDDPEAPDAREKYEQAIESFKQAIRVKPDFAEAHYSLGLVYGN